MTYDIKYIFVNTFLHLYKEYLYVFLVPLRILRLENIALFEINARLFVLLFSHSD